MCRKLMISLIVLLGLVLSGLFVLEKFNPRTVSQNSSSHLVQYIEKTQQVVFLNVGVQRIETQKKNARIFSSFDLPFSEKKAIIILNYQAKLGIKKPVSIKEMGDKRYQVTIPAFEVIGVEQAKVNPYQLYDESGELLSGLTKSIDTGELVAKALTNEEQLEYLEKYQESLRESAQSYYEILFNSLVPDSELDFVFQ